MFQWNWIWWLKFFALLIRNWKSAWPAGQSGHEARCWGQKLRRGQNQSEMFVCFHIDDAHGVLEIRSVGFLEAAYNIFTVTYRFSLMLIKCYGSIIWQLWPQCLLFLKLVFFPGSTAVVVFCWRTVLTSGCFGNVCGRFPGFTSFNFSCIGTCVSSQYLGSFPENVLPLTVTALGNTLEI